MGASTLSGLAAVIGVTVACIGAIHLSAWASGLMAVRGLSSITMKTNTALCLVLLGASLAFVAHGRPGLLRRSLARVLAAPAFTIAVLTLLENVLAFDLGLDQLLAHEPQGALGVLSPNRMGLPASASISLAGLALWLLADRHRRAARVAQAMSLAIVLIALLASIGYLYGAQPLYAVAPVSAIAWPTAGTLLLLAVGLLCARPADGLMAQVTVRDPGGANFRRLLLPMLLVPIAAGWLRVAGERRHWFDAPLGTALMMVLFIVTFSALTYAASRKVSHSAAADRAAQVERERLLLQVGAERQRLESVLARLPFGVITATAPSGRILYANAYAERILGPLAGADPPACLERWALRHEDGRPFGLEQLPIVRALSGEVVASEAAYLLRGDGARIDLAMSAVPIRDSSRVVETIVAFEDVSERKRVERALRDSQLDLNRAQAVAHIGSWRLDVRKDELSWSDEAYRIFGVSPGTPLNYRDFLELVHPDDRERVDRAWGAALRGAPYSLEHRILVDSEVRWVHERAELEFDAEGGLVGGFGTVQDATAQKLADQALQRSESELHTIVETASQGIIVTDLDGRLRHWNRAALEMHGLATLEPTQRTLQDVVAGFQLSELDGTAVPAAEWPLMRILSGERLSDWELRMRRIGSEWQRVYSFGGTLVRDGTGRGFMAVVTINDVSGRKRVEAESQAARISAEQANQAKDHFIAVLSHELRTPLAPVLTGLALLEGQEATPERRKVLDVIRRNVELESRLIDDLLDITRIARGKVELHKTTVALRFVLERAVEVCQPEIDARRLELQVDYGPQPFLLQADAARLQQVFWNLLKNAIKFTPAGGRLGVCCRGEDGYVVVEVSDNGIGIEPAALAGIFDAFSQAERSTAREFGGLGLGLAICRAMVELHGGTIQARSDGRDRGAAFTVRLPLLPSQADDVPDAPERADLTPSPRARLRILLVEDHADTAATMVAMLELEGHAVRAAADAASALAMLAREPYDVLISDLGLPDRSGMDLMRELRSRGHSLPGIALSGYGQESDLEKTRAAGFALHLVKPVDPQRLFHALESAARKPEPG